MENLTEIIRLPFVETLGWTLLHFVWQGVLIALILTALLWLLKNHHPSLRYGLSCASLAVMFLCPIITYLVLEARTTTQPIAELALPPQTEAAQPVLVADNEPAQPVVAPVVFVDAGAREKQTWLEKYLKPYLPYLVAFWGIGVLVLSIRLLGGLWYLRKLRTRLTKPVSAALMSQLNNVAERLGLARTVQLRESLAVTVPLVVGWIRPMILLPSSAIMGLSVKQLEMILAHELAHIRRHDYLVNLLQSIVETLLFYHPAVWWVSHRIRVEREHCCDDVAVTVCGGDRESYAEALADLDRLRPRVKLAQAASGGSLLNRIARLLDIALPRALEPKQWLAGLSMIAISVVLFTVIGMNLTTAQVDQTGNSTDDATQARLRVSNCVYNGPNVDIYINGKIAEAGGATETNVAFYAWAYSYLTPGTYTITVVPTGKDISEAMMETDVTVEAGHRYTVVMLGQADEATHTPLVIDETKVYQDIGATPTDAAQITVNNLRGVSGMDIAIGGSVNKKNIPYGGFQAAIWPSGNVEGITNTVSGTTDQYIDDPDIGTVYISAASEVFECFGGIYNPGTRGQDYDGRTSWAFSSLNVVDYLKALSQQGQADSRLPTFEIFLKALETAGLTETIINNPHLVYAPSDAAFEALPKEQLDALLADPKALADVARYHIVEGYYPYGTLPGGSRPELKVTLTNLLGKELKLLPDLTINGVGGDESTRPLSRIVVSNGTRLEPLTFVLMPPSQ